ncbi:MAG: 3-hydroxyacyl-[acyl-carrier-protein] dehydratase FabZ [Gammaproteobacteria bacterium RIFCSPLOWO2_02_FULL_56_15]|nr:MAG: 3-hydroxyacyl-[acyl-carrier-protein] dehydratase FabZ [Gammaproteobacteria bacterium RIFCSPLOWO2_02_FULL_56_15]
MTTMKIGQITNLLPHRYPFLLLDRILSCEPFGKLTAIKNVTINEPHFQGHFPGKPIMPGVLIIEAMAQAAAILGEQSLEYSPGKESLYYLVGIDKARFRQTVEPGDQLIIEVNYLTVKRNIWKFRATASVDDRVVASAEFLTTVVNP